MANVIAEAAVRIRPDTAGFHSEVQSGVLGSLKKVAAAAGGIFVAEKIFGSVLSSMEEFDANARQTTAVLKSTGGAANVTAKHVKDLANSIEAYSSIDDQAVTASENLLLTFRNVRNEVGKGNDVYDQAEKAIANVSVGMKEDLQSATIQVGKALNDPVKGMTALQRIGITLSDHQKELVKRFQDSGQTMKAQKVILGELNKEFGGSAKALGGSLQGQITLVKDLFGDMARDLGLKLLPYLVSGTKAIIRWTPVLIDFVKTALAPIVKVAGEVVSALAPIAGGVADMIGTFTKMHDAGAGLKDSLRGVAEKGLTSLGLSMKQSRDVINEVSDALGKTFGHALTQITTAIGPIKKFVTDTFQGIADGIHANMAEITETFQTILGVWSTLWRAEWDVFSAVLEAVWPVIKTTITVALKVIGDVLKVAMDIINGHWGKAWDDLKQLVVDTLEGLGKIVWSILTNLGPLILQAIGLLAGAAAKLGLAILDALIGEVEKLPGQLFALYIALGRKELEAIGWVAGKAKDVGIALVKALITEAKKLPGQVWDLLQLVGRKEDQAIGYIAGKAHDLGVAIVHAVVKEVKALPGQIWDIIKQIPGKFSQVWGKIQSGIGDGWQKIVSTVEGWINKLLTPVNWVLGKLGVDKIGFASGGIATSKQAGVHKFASGGIVGPGKAGIYRPVPGGVLKMVEAGHPEAVIPLDPSKKNRALELINEVLNRLKVRPQAASGGIFSAPSFGIGGIAGSIAGAAGAAWDALTDPVALLKRFLPSIPDLGAAIPAKIAEGLMKKLVDGVLSYVKGHAADGLVGRALGEATRMTNLRQPYLWGGGHSGFSRMGPWDCSGAVSQLLHAIGAPITSPLTSGGFLNWGKAGSGPITILTNPEHVYSMIAGRAYGTSDFNPGGGFGGPLPYGVRSGFTARTFRSGGIVPGYGPQPAIVHGGEMVLTNQDRQRFGGLAQLARSVDRLVGKLDKQQDGMRIGEVSFHTEQRSFDALKREALNRLALQVAAR